jgi:methyl-accepting chemotaxis protein
MTDKTRNDDFNWQGIMKLLSNFSIRGKLLILILPPVAIALITLTEVSRKSFEEIVLKQQQDHLKEMVSKTEVELNTWIESRHREVDILTWNSDILSGSATNPSNYLQQYMKASPFLENAFLTNDSGIIMHDGIGGKSVGVDLKAKSQSLKAFEAAKNGKIFLSDAFPSPVSGRPVALLTAPVLAGDVQLGLVGTPIEILNFSKSFVEEVKIGKEGTITVLDTLGNVIADSKPEKIFKENLIQTAWGKAFSGPILSSFTYMDNGIEKAGLFTKSESTGWIVFASIPTSELYAPVKQIYYKSWMLCIFVMLIITAVIYWLSQVIYKSLQDVIESLLKVGNHIKLASSEVATSAVKIAERNSHQASALQQTSAAITEIKEMVQLNTQNAQKSTDFSNVSKDTAVKGQEVTSRMSESMTVIFNSNEELKSYFEEQNHNISSISNVMSRIEEKTKVINDIVFQTKILSFNASVEAARAGEHGKGFSIVAEEVGALAVMSGNAAKEIHLLLKESTDTVRSIVENAQVKSEQIIINNRSRVETGKHATGECENVLEEIVNHTTKVSGLITDISNASIEQTACVTEISRAIEEINNIMLESVQYSSRATDLGQKLEENVGSLEKATDNLVSEVFGASGLHLA